MGKDGFIPHRFFLLLPPLRLLLPPPPLPLLDDFDDLRHLEQLPFTSSRSRLGLEHAFPPGPRASEHARKSPSTL